MTEQIAKETMLQYGRVKLKMNLKIINTLNLPDKFVFAICEHGVSPEGIMDNLYSVNKNTGKVDDFIPSMDPENFKKAIAKL